MSGRIAGRSASMPSLGIRSFGTEGRKRPSQMTHAGWIKLEKSRGMFLWEGRMRKVTLATLNLPWNTVFQNILLMTIIYKYVLHLLLAYYFQEESFSFVDMTLHITEGLFIVDVAVHCVHRWWPAVRLYMRVYRRHIIFLLFDIVSMLPLTTILKFHPGYDTTTMLAGRWLAIARIYRIFPFFKQASEKVHCGSRKIIYLIENILCVLLTVHMGSCILYYNHNDVKAMKSWYKLGYPENVNSHRIKLDNYAACWYYCTCRIFNVIFGDIFPLSNSDKWLTSFLMVIGYVVFRYQFTGMLAWELVLENSRMSLFVEQYHHMISYLQLREVPKWLMDQAMNYKQKLWIMKDGVLTCDELNTLPLPLQMELVFDINIVHFHNSLLFRDAEEAFLRQISLLMKHELYLTGQNIWSQDVVKTGMICIKRGVIEMLSDEDDESPIIAFTQGTVLGELSLFYSIPAKVTVQAATYVELQVLQRTDFMRIAEEHPIMLAYVRNKIELRLKKCRQRQEAIEEYDKGDSRLIRTRYRPMKVLKDNLQGIEEEDPTFIDDSHMYYKDKHNVREPKFTTEYLELYQISSKVTTVDNPKVCLNANFPWILQPDTAFTQMFDIVHFLLVLSVCMLSPYYALQTKKLDFESMFTFIIIGGQLLNIYIQLTTAIVEKNVTKDTVREIAKVKMASVGFYLDILSVFPLYIFSDTLDPAGQSVIGQIVKLFPLLQVWHIWKYIHKWKQNFYANNKLLTLLKFTILFIVASYWSGCLLYLYACPRKQCLEKSWMSQLIYWETKVFVTNEARHERPLHSAFAFGTSVFTLNGYSDIAPGLNDYLMVVFLIYLGGYVITFYTAKICSIYLLETRRKLQFKGSLSELFYFLSVNRVCSKIKTRVEKFFYVQWYYNKAVSAKEIFNDMSTNIQQEILSLEMVGTLQYCPIFQNCNRDFLQTVSAGSKMILLPDDEVVQHAGDIGRDMYVLQKGHCNVLNHNGKVVKSIGPGSHFGDLEMLFGLPKVYTVMTTTNCILLHVEYRTLVQCWGTFPDISHPIITVLEDREIKEEAAKYEEAKPLTGKLEAKTNRLAKELKESFVIVQGYEEQKQYAKAFDKLGVMRFIKYFFFPACITPHGFFLKFWCTLRFIFAVYYVCVIPYNMATKHQSQFYYEDIFLYVDIIIMAYVAYYNEDSVLVTHPLLTVSRYLKHTFLLDAISIFPFEQLVRIVNENNNLDMYRMNRMLLLTRVTGAFNYWEEDIMKVNIAVVLLKFLPIAMTFVNVATACFFINSCHTFKPDSNSPYISAQCSKALSVSTKTQSTDVMFVYVQTFLWAFEIFVGSGCSTINVSNHVDVWLTMVLQISGLIYFAFMFGYVSSTRTASTHALLDHSEQTKDLANFLYQENVDPMLISKTLKYFEYVWKRTNGSNAQKICRRLNSALMEDTLVFMYEKALREVPLFGKVERSFIRVITQHLDEMYFLKGETVIQYQDVQSNIYIIYRGKVDVLSSYNEMITCMGPGGMFGNFSGKPLACSTVAIYASRSLDLLVIPGQKFFNLVKFYPKLQEPLEKAFELSKDYILPITMHWEEETSSGDTSEVDEQSFDTAYDTKSESSRDLDASSMARSQSNMSQTKSSASVATHHSYMSVINLLRPETNLFLSFGYCTCIVATLNYLIVFYEIVTLNNCLAFFWAQAVLDIFFYLKMYLTMHQGYLTKNGEVVIDAVKCRRKYFNRKFWFWIDIIANAPLEFIGFAFRDPLKAMHYFRINKLLRLSYLIEFYKRTSAELTNNITILQATMTFIIVILIMHTFTCIWLITMITISSTPIIRTLKMHLIDEVTSQRLWDYVSALYIVVSQTTVTGGDEFLITEPESLLILSVSMVNGKMLAAIVVATAIQIAYSTKYAMTQYEKSTTELVDMLKNQGLSSYQLKKLIKYVKQLWTTERGRQLPVLLQSTPHVRRCTLMSAMFGQHLRNCYVFAQTGEAFLRQLAGALEYTTFFPGNYIVVAGDCEAKMYWVSSGTVAVVSVRPDLTETTHEYLHKDDVFGVLQGLNRGIPHCFSYRAQTKVGIVTLSLDSWSSIVSFFPEAKRVITESGDILFAEPFWKS